MGWEQRQPEVELWHGYDAVAFGYDEQTRIATRALFDAADVFITTVGLSDIWYDAPTGKVFWCAVPAAQHDPSRHRFRVSTVDENQANLTQIHRLNSTAPAHASLSACRRSR